MAEVSHIESIRRLQAVLGGFSAAINSSACITNFVSHEMFKELVKAKHELPECTKDQPSPITKDDENALRYVSGYVCRKVQVQCDLSGGTKSKALRSGLMP